MISQIEKAIQRMEKVEAACDELIGMAKADLAELEKRKQRAQIVIEGFKMLPISAKDEHKLLVEKIAIEIVEADLADVCCMGTGIKV